MMSISEPSRIMSRDVCHTLVGVIGGPHTPPRSRLGVTASHFFASSSEVMVEQSPCLRSAASPFGRSRASVISAASLYLQRCRGRPQSRTFERSPNPAESEAESTSYVMIGFIRASIVRMVAPPFCGTSRATTMPHNHALQRILLGCHEQAFC